MEDEDHAVSAAEPTSFADNADYHGFEEPAELQYQSNTTPNNTVVDYWPGPDPRRHYRVNGNTVPSVTQVLDVLDKQALKLWYQRGGTEGTLRLIRMGEIGRLNGEPVLANTPGYPPATEAAVTELLKQHQLTPQNVMEKAGERGTAVHQALELWISDEILPDPDMYPDDQRGYVQGLLAFLQDLRVADHSKIESEVMVGSAKHGFAGRFDMRLTMNACELRTTPKRGAAKEFPSRTRWLLDLKTSRSVYSSHYWQLEAYEGASVECGYQKTAGRAVVRVTEDGLYEVKVSKAKYRDFLAIKRAYDVVNPPKEAA